jgi:hypothetical protein
MDHIYDVSEAGSSGLQQAMKMFSFWNDAPCGLDRRFSRPDKEAVISSETSVYFFQTTWRNIAVNSRVLNCHRQKHKSHQRLKYFNEPS